ncbi:MAG TPA: Hsp20/alpha crystallin family protein [Methanomicrobiales archaeon]|nr:Hsp20/alpha crystallin family protein [Methanomicrobiales archaeon]
MSRNSPGTGRWFPEICGPEFKVDILEEDDEIVIIADLPGVEKEDISLQILDRRTLLIAAEYRQKHAEVEEEYYLHERAYGVTSRALLLPVDVSEDEASARFKNGTLEVHLRRSSIPHENRIQIE